MAVLDHHLRSKCPTSITPVDLQRWLASYLVCSTLGDEPEIGNVYGSRQTALVRRIKDRIERNVLKDLVETMMTLGGCEQLEVCLKHLKNNPLTPKEDTNNDHELDWQAIAKNVMQETSVELTPVQCQKLFLEASLDQVDDSSWNPSVDDDDNDADGDVAMTTEEEHDAKFAAPKEGLSRLLEKNGGALHTPAVSATGAEPGFCQRQRIATARSTSGTAATSR